ncbi:hypothetical protein [Streptomyces canus]|nr:hypothetical protein [Streptomyces canus]
MFSPAGRGLYAPSADDWRNWLLLTMDGVVPFNPCNSVPAL